MFQPRPATGHAPSDLSVAPPEYFLYLDGRTIASPVFRFLIWCDGGWNDPANRAALLKIFDLFMQRRGDQLRSLTRPDRQGHWRNQPLTDALIAEIRDEIAAPAADHPLGMRLAGWIDAPHFIESAPCLRCGELGDLGYLSLEMPHDAPDLVRAARQVAAICAEMSLRCGVAGFGFFLPDYLESLIFAFPMATQGVTAAIEVTPYCAAGCIAPDRSGEGTAPDDGHGLIDIGWMTLIGRPFHGRLDDASALSAVDGVTVERTENQILITAGPEPIWGDHSGDPRLDPYIAVAAYLRPLRVASRLAANHLFGGDNDDPDRRERVRAYLRRFDR